MKYAKGDTVNIKAKIVHCRGDDQYEAVVGKSPSVQTCVTVHERDLTLVEGNSGRVFYRDAQGAVHLTSSDYTLERFKDRWKHWTFIRFFDPREFE